MSECRQPEVIAIMRRMDRAALSRLQSKVARKRDRKLRSIDKGNHKNGPRRRQMISIDNRALGARCKNTTLDKGKNTILN